MLMEGWYALIAFVTAFLVAQIWKTVAGIVGGHATKKRMTWQEMIGYFSRSGGMPSGHSASFTALTVFLGCAEGFQSGLFALAVGSLIIVLYDATHVRYAVGKQGEALNELLEKAGKSDLPLVEGHTVGQVAVGILIGVIVGVGVFGIVSSGL